MLAFYFDEQHLDTRSEHNKDDDDLQLLISPFTTGRKIAGIY